METWPLRVTAIDGSHCKPLISNRRGHYGLVGNSGHWRKSHCLRAARLYCAAVMLRAGVITQPYVKVSLVPLTDKARRARRRRSRARSRWRHQNNAALYAMICPRIRDASSVGMAATGEGRRGGLDQPQSSFGRLAIKKAQWALCARFEPFSSKLAVERPNGGADTCVGQHGVRVSVQKKRCAACLLKTLAWNR